MFEQQEPVYLFYLLIAQFIPSFAYSILVVRNPHVK